MDEVEAYLRRRWQALGAVGALFALDEHAAPPGDAPGGTWQHFKATLPPWFTLWFRRGP